RRSTYTPDFTWTMARPRQHLTQMPCSTEDRAVSKIERQGGRPFWFTQPRLALYAPVASRAAGWYITGLVGVHTGDSDSYDATQQRIQSRAIRHQCRGSLLAARDEHVAVCWSTKLQSNRSRHA